MYLIRAIFLLSIGFFATTGLSIPGTDISLFRIHSVNGSMAIEFARQLVVRDGYDNQPAFTADSQHVLFTRMDDEGKTDIWQVSIKSGELTRLTTTEQNEYSPTPVLGDNSYSTVIAHQGKQTLWQQSSGKFVQQLNADIEPVGYHTWISADRLALFRLADPHELVILDRQSGEHQVITKDIGRCLVTLGNNDEFYFVQNGANRRMIKRHSLLNKASESVIPLLEGSEDFTWHKNWGLVHSNGNQLFYAPKPYHQWISLASDKALTNISRLAISPNGQWLAVVHDDLTNDVAH